MVIPPTFKAATPVGAVTSTRLCPPQPETGILAACHPTPATALIRPSWLESDNNSFPPNTFPKEKPHWHRPCTDITMRLLCAIAILVATLLKALAADSATNEIPFECREDCSDQSFCSPIGTAPQLSPRHRRRRQRHQPQHCRPSETEARQRSQRARRFNDSHRL